MSDMKQRKVSIPPLQINGNFITDDTAKEVEFNELFVLNPELGDSNPHHPYPIIGEN